MVVVDGFSKNTPFIAAPTDCQSNSQTKCINALLELYLRHYMSANQRDWAKLLDVAQFSYNLHQSKATNRSPFEIIMRQ